MSSPHIYSDFVKRLGKGIASRRLRIQTEHSAEFYSHNGLSNFHIENVEFIPKLLKVLLLATGQLERGRRNALDYRVETTRVAFPRLPPAFDGLRILQISDPHLDGIPDGGEKLRHLLQGLKFDLCVFTGDFRFLTAHDHEFLIKIYERLAPHLTCEFGVLAVLGNHDFLEIVPPLEAKGVRVLLNEAVVLERGDAAIGVAGVDDPHYYGTHDIEKAMRPIMDLDFRLLLCHSPELYAQAPSYGVDYFLCGHTHGGQICLPGGIPILTNASCPRRFVKGPWEFGPMRGYTSRGTGSSGLSVRFFCPPELTLHTLLSRHHPRG